MEQETENKPLTEQETEKKPERKKTWKLPVAAAFILTAVILSGTTRALALDAGVPSFLVIFFLVILPANAVWGAYTRKMRNWTLVGAICSVLSMPLFGIPALILVIDARYEFRSRIRPFDD